jgi:hypothetical protein
MIGIKMNIPELNRKLVKFQNDSTVASHEVVVDGITKNSPQKETIERSVEGKLADDVRKRVMAPADAPVTVVEVNEMHWLTDWTSDTDYRMVVKCNGVEEEFDSYSAADNFRRLLEWLDEEPYEGEY